MNLPAFTIRDAVPSDLEALQIFLRPFVKAKQLLPRTDDDLSVLIEHGFVASSEQEIVGFAAIEIYSRKMAEVQSLAVAAEMQGRGVGTALVKRCVERATHGEGQIDAHSATR